MTDRTRRCPSGCWSIGGEVVAMASTQSRAWCPLFPLLCWWCDPMSSWRWCGRWGQHTEQKRTRRAGWQTERGAALLVAGRSVERWWRWHPPRAGQGARSSISFVGGATRWAAGDGADGEDNKRSRGEARNGRRGRRHPSPWFSLFLSFCLLLFFLYI